MGVKIRAMAPWVEKFRVFDEESGTSLAYFTVDLNIKLRFDVNSFKQQAKSVCSSESSFYLKFFVVNDVMYFFEDFTDMSNRKRYNSMTHYEVYKRLSPEGELQCAGKVEIKGDILRFSAFNSETMQKGGVLTYNKSFLYYHDILKPVLKSSFTF